ncbi:MAG: SAM-dependent methyltransferase, partial [Elusimicrobiota bacterium]|nr:SAM-dependent methyltransferase [Elusimicrobiota bacterium]
MVLNYVNGKSMKLNHNNILDQYFTKHLVAEKLFKEAKQIVSSYENNDLKKYTWIEPSVGEGCFFD